MFALRGWYDLLKILKTALEIIEKNDSVLKLIGKSGVANFTNIPTAQVFFARPFNGYFSALNISTFGIDNN